MTAADKKKAQFLVGLVVIAGLTWFLVYRTGVATSSADAKKQGANKPKTAKPLPDPTIHIGLIEPSHTGDVGRKNIFQYGQKPLPPAPPVTVRPNPVPVVQTQPPAVYTLPPPPAPVMKTFKYDGLSVVGSAKSGRAMASLTDGTNSYQVTLGECLMGQYCVRQISENSIEIEDVQLKQRRTFQKTPAQ